MTQPEHWTRKTPQETGLYWWRSGLTDTPRVMEIVKTVSGNVVEMWYGDSYLVRTFGQWFGPISPPVAPESVFPTSGESQDSAGLPQGT